MSNMMIPEHWRTLLGSNDCPDVLKQGFPTRRWEGWKYTDISNVINYQFKLPIETDTDLDGLTVDKIENSIQIVLVDGVLSRALSQIADLPEGIRVTEQNDPVQRSTSVEAQQPFVDVNNVLVNCGILIEVQAGAIITQTIHLLFVNTGSQQDTMWHWRHQLLIGKNAQVSIVEEYTSQTQACYFNNIVFDIALAAGAQLKICKLQQESENAYHIANTQVSQQDNSRIESYSISLGAALSRDDLAFDLRGMGAECAVRGLYLAKNKQHMDHHTVIRHLASHCTSEQMYKGIVTHAARAVFNGKILVAEGTVQTIAHQSNHNLLLSSEAEIDTKPELEVYADDVQCSHGATVGQLDQHVLFYLQSRGISLEQAQRLLMSAFIEDVISHVNEISLQKYIQKALLRKEF
jgi:Fe-S cluster assembly protein SufD